MKNINFLVFAFLLLLPVGHAFAESNCPQTISFDDARKAVNKTHPKSFKPTANPPKDQDPIEKVLPQKGTSKAYSEPTLQSQETWVNDGIMWCTYKFDGKITKRSWSFRLVVPINWEL